MDYKSDRVDTPRLATDQCLGTVQGVIETVVVNAKYIITCRLARYNNYRGKYMVNNIDKLLTQYPERW